MAGARSLVQFADWRKDPRSDAGMSEEPCSSQGTPVRVRTQNCTLGPWCPWVRGGRWSSAPSWRLHPGHQGLLLGTQVWGPSSRPGFSGGAQQRTQIHLIQQVAPGPRLRKHMLGSLENDNLESSYLQNWTVTHSGFRHIIRRPAPGT